MQIFLRLLLIAALGCVILNETGNASDLEYDKHGRRRTFSLKNTTPYLATVSGTKGSKKTRKKFIVDARSDKSAAMMAKNKKRKLGWDTIKVLSVKKATKSEIKQYGSLKNSSTSSDKSGDRGQGSYTIRVKVTLQSGKDVIETVTIRNASSERTAKSKAAIKAKLKHKKGDKYRKATVISSDKL